MSRLARDSQTDAASLQALLRASHELGPEMEQELIDAYVSQHDEATVSTNVTAPLVRELLGRTRFTPALLLGTNIGLGALLEHLLATVQGTWVGTTWLPQPVGLGTALSVLILCNVAVSVALLFSLAALRACGPELWARARQARSAIGAAAVSAACLACFDGYWASAGKGFWTPGSDIAIAMAIATAIAVVLGLLSYCVPYWHDAAHALARLARRSDHGQRPELLEGPRR
jgi:hypothetical protein